MEGELLSPSSSVQQPPKQEKTFTEAFWEAFPFYLNCGMTPEQFWDGDVNYTRGFRSAYWKRVDHENELAWLQGYYFYTALASIMPATSMKFKNHKFEKYPEKPIPITDTAVKKEREEKQKAEFKKNLDFMKQFMTLHNNKT